VSAEDFLDAYAEALLAAGAMARDAGLCVCDLLQLSFSLTGRRVELSVVAEDGRLLDKPRKTVRYT
jgi:hypothetical protein